MRQGVGDAGGVGQREVTSGDAWFGCHDFGFAMTFSGAIGDKLPLGDSFMVTLLFLPHRMLRFEIPRADL